jgi:hypothetical protein
MTWVPTIDTVGCRFSRQFRLKLKYHQIGADALLACSESATGDDVRYLQDLEENDYYDEAHATDWTYKPPVQDGTTCFFGDFQGILRWSLVAHTHTHTHTHTLSLSLSLSVSLAHTDFSVEIAYSSERLAQAQSIDAEMSVCCKPNSLAAGIWYWLAYTRNHSGAGFGKRRLASETRPTTLDSHQSNQYRILQRPQSMCRVAVL